MNFQFGLYARKFGALVLALLLGLVFSVSCEKKEDDNTNLLVGLALLNQGNNAVASQQAAVTVSGVTSANSSIASQAGSGSLTMADPLFGGQSKRQIARLMLQKKLDYDAGREVSPHLLPTALSTTTGSCTSSGCNATIDGTLSCSGGGSMTLNSYQLNSTISYTSGSNYSGNFSMNGGISFSSCTMTVFDIMTMPNYTVATLNGDIQVSGTSNFSSNTASGTYTFTNDLKTTSSNLSYNGAAAVAVDVTEKSNITQTITAAGYSSTTNGTVTTSGATMTITLNGSVTRTGTVGGVSINSSKTFNNETHTFTFTCTYDSANPQNNSCSIN